MFPSDDSCKQSFVSNNKSSGGVNGALAATRTQVLFLTQAPALRRPALTCTDNHLTSEFATRSTFRVYADRRFCHMSKDFPSRRDVAAQLSLMAKEKLSFFSHTPVLACEESSLFSQVEKPKIQPILCSGTGQATDLTFAGVVSDLEISAAPLKISFVVLKPKAKNAGSAVFLFDMVYCKIMYYPDADRSEWITNPNSISVVDSWLSWRDEKFRIVTPRERSGLPGIIAAMKSWVSSVGSQEAKIPVNRHTLPFWTAFCCDLQTLFVMAVSERSRAQESNYGPWINACGKHLPFMIHYIGYLSYQPLDGPASAFRGNSFFSRIVMMQIRNDKAIMQLADKICELDLNADPVQYVITCLDQFDASTISPFAAYCLRILWIEGLRRFPNDDACYYGVSGALFLRLVWSRLVGPDDTSKWETPEGKKAKSKLLSLTNMRVTQEISEQDCERLKKFIERVATVELGEIPIDDTVTQETIEALMGTIQSRTDDFLSETHLSTFGANLEQFTKWRNECLRKKQIV